MTEQTAETSARTSGCARPSWPWRRGAPGRLRRGGQGRRRAEVVRLEAAELAERRCDLWRGHCVRQPDQRGEAAGLSVPQPDSDPVPGGQAADHEQAHPAGHGHVDYRRVVEPPVSVRHLLVGDAHAAVGDVEEHTAAGQRLAGNVHLAVFRGERRRVLDDLGHQVHDVVDGLADDDDARLDVEDNPLVLLDLGDRRAQHVDQRNRLAPPPVHLVAREDQQVLGVTAHAGGQVVQAEQAGQTARVLLALLQRVDQRQLPLDQRLAAPGQVDEHGVQVAAQHGLVGREPDRLEVNLIEGAGDFTDLVGGGDPDRLDIDALVGAFALAEPTHHLRQPVAGHVERVGTELTQRAGQRAGHQDGDEQDQEQQHQGQDAGKHHIPGGIASGRIC